MSYFVGKNLARKIQEYDLLELDMLLGSIANGTGKWPGELGMPTPDDCLETMRVVVYSLLHKYGLKSEFVVKMVPSKSVIMINFKHAPATQRRTGGIQRLDSAISPTTTSGAVMETMKEDMTGLFAGGDPLLEEDAQ